MAKVGESVFLFHRDHVAGKGAVQLHQLPYGGTNNGVLFLDQSHLLFELILIPAVIRIQESNVVPLGLRDTIVSGSCNSQICRIFQIPDPGIF